MGQAHSKFSTLDAEKHTRVADAIKSAISAGFISEKPKNSDTEIFVRKSIEHFVREIISVDDLDKSEFPTSDLDQNEDTDAKETAPEFSETELPSQEEINDGFEEVPSLLDETTEFDEDRSEIGKPDQNTEAYEEGFSAGRAAALSELEEQRIEHLNVLKSIAERLQNDSCFDFDDISSKVLDTVYALSSERCGLAIESDAKGFLNHVEKHLDQIRSLSNEKRVSFNPEDLETLKSFDEFEELFQGVDIKSDDTLNRGDVIVKVGGVEIRDTPFSDHENR